jgi:hypothetical protein
MRGHLMGFTEVLATYKDLGYGGLFLITICAVGRYLLSQNKLIYDQYEKHVTEHKNEMKDITMQLLKVVEQNTKANTALAKSIEHLDIRVQAWELNRPNLKK